MNKIKIATIIAILALGIYVALSPNVVYAPTPKIILYFFISFLPGFLFGAEAASKFKFKLAGFAFTTAGAVAVCLGVLVLLTYLSKPSEKIAVFQVLDEEGSPVPIDWKGAVIVPPTLQGLTVTKYVEGNTLVLIFPEQTGEVEIQIKKSPSDKPYSGLIGYAGSRTAKIFLGKQLKKAGST